MTMTAPSMLSSVIDEPVKASSGDAPIDAGAASTAGSAELRLSASTAARLGDVPPDVVEPAGVEVFGSQLDDAEPSTPIPFPQALTGAPTGAPAALPAVVGWVPVGTLQRPAELPPNPTLLPHAVTGAVTGTVAVEPDAPDEPAGLVPF